MSRVKKCWNLSILLIFIFSFALAGCGGGGGGSSSSGTPVEGTAQLGNLANATVKIYEISDNGTAVLKWIETTSNGTTLDEIGKFNTHSNELNPDRYYLYEVIGGEDWDANDDGIRDDNATPNKGVIRAVAKGSNIQYAGSDFRVTFASEAVYEQVAKYLKYDFNPANFAAELQKSVQSVVGDVNNDGVVNVEDMLTFNPAFNKNKLKGICRYEMDNITDNIHHGRYVYTNISPVIGEINTGTSSANSIALSSDGKYAYVATNNGLKIIDITDPQNMKVIKTLDDNDSIEGVSFSPDGSKAYVADGKQGLQILNTDNLSIISTIDNTTGIYGVAADPRGGYVYITNYDSGAGRYYFKVIDTNNKTVIKSYNDNNSSVYNGVAVYHNTGNNTTYAYVVGYNGTNYGLWIFDVTNPDNITVKTFIPDGNEGEPWSVSISPDGKYVYVGCNYGLEIFNVSNPESATVAANLDLPLLFSTGNQIAVSDDGKYIYVPICNGSNPEHSGGVEIVDVSNHKNPKLLAIIATHCSAYGAVLSKDEKYLYIAMYKGIEIADLSVVTSSDVVGNINLNSWAMDAAVSKNGRYVYVADYKNGLQVVDVSKPFAPYIIDNVSGWEGYAYGVAVSPNGNYAYAVNYSNDFWVVNVSKPENPAILDSVSIGTGSHPQSITVSPDDKYAYVADGSAGLKIVNLDNLSVSTVSLSGGDAYGVAVYGKYAYVADGSAGLKIVSLDNLSVSTVSLSGGDAYGVAVYGKYAYVADGTYGLRIVDLDNKSEIASCSIPGSSENVALSSDGSYAYVATNNGLTIVDASEPKNPKVIYNIPMPDDANSVTVSPDGRYLYVSDGIWGLQIVDLKLFKQ